MILTTDQRYIQKLSDEILKYNLFCETTGVAKYIFQGNATVYKLAYIPGIAWVMYTSWPPPWSRNRIQYMAYTHPQHRNKGHRTRLYHALTKIK